jgi:hypothetical protein
MGLRRRLDGLGKEKLDENLKPRGENTDRIGEAGAARRRFVLGSLHSR